MRPKLIIGNWKMNTTISQEQQLLGEIVAYSGTRRYVVVCVPYITIPLAQQALRGANVGLGAQNVAWEDKGAYTGEISPLQLREYGVTFALVGHSERRQYFCETDQTVNAKVVACIRHGIVPIICVGETAQDRNMDRAVEVIAKQLQVAYRNVLPENAINTVLAYEPVWAIGTGSVASAQVAQQAIAAIRKILDNIYPSLYAPISSKISIVYGGSVDIANASGLLIQPDIDGLLIGGASLNAKEFCAIASM